MPFEVGRNVPLLVPEGDPLTTMTTPFFSLGAQPTTTTRMALTGEAPLTVSESKDNSLMIRKTSVEGPCPMPFMVVMLTHR